jgi:microcystin-dependent protein
MPSTNQLSVNSRSMNGLNTINANAVFTDSIEVGNLQIDIQGTAPTRISGDNTTNIATTQFVQNAVITAGGSYVDLTSAQNITGTKTFNDINVNLTLEANYISNLSSIDTPSIGSGLQTDNINIVSNQTTGILNLGCRTDRTGNINIGTLATGNAPIVIGSTASSTQTATHNAITTFNKIPSCSTAPTSANHLCNKTYVDSTSGSALLSSNNTWTGNNTFSGSTCVFGGGSSNTVINGAVVNVGTVATTNLYLSSTNISTSNTTNFTIGNAVTFNLVPTGTVIMHVSNSVSGFYLCNGASLSTVSASKLFAVIGYTYGGSGANFNLPNFQGVFIRGAGSQTVSGTTYTANAVGTVQQDAVLNPLYASNEGFRSCAAGARDCVARDIITTDPTDTNTGILPRFDRTATENRPVNHSLYYHIRF